MPEKFRPEPPAEEFKAELADVESAEEKIDKAHDAAAVEDFVRVQRKGDTAGAESRNRALKTLRSLEATDAVNNTKSVEDLKRQIQAIDTTKQE